MNDHEPNTHAPGNPDEGYPGIREWDGSEIAGGEEVVAILLGASSSWVGASSGPVIVAAREGDVAWIVMPTRIGEFLLVHVASRLVCEQSGVIHGILDAHLALSGEKLARIALWEFSRTGRLLDVILLDQLLDMAALGVEKNPCRLAGIAGQRCGLAIPDEKPDQSASGPLVKPISEYRDEIADLDLIKILTALLMVYKSLREGAEAVTQRLEFEHVTIEESGLLSLAIQVRGAIALEMMTRQGGLRIQAASDLIERCDEAFRDSSRFLLKDRNSSKCFRSEGSVIEVDQAGRPKVYGRQLEDWLSSRVRAVQGVHGLSFDPPYSAPDRVARSSNLWADLASYDPAIAAWERLETAASAIKVLQEVRRTASGIIRPAYQTLPRIRSVKPNLASLRRLSPGPLFSAPTDWAPLVGELCDLELRCVADWFSECPDLGSTLREFFQTDLDPTRFAAAALHCRHEFRSGRPFDGRFEDLEREKPKTFNLWMIIAMHILQHSPRRLTFEWMVKRIEADLGEGCEPILASEILWACRTTVSEIFPELDWLRWNGTNIRVNGSLPADVNLGMIGPDSRSSGFAHKIRDVIKGERVDPSLSEQLNKLSEGREDQVDFSLGSPALYDRIFRIPKRTGFGRIRGKMETYQAEVMAYLDRADDIRKTVLYELVAADHKLVAASGDEFVLLVPITERAAGRAATINESCSEIKTLVEGVIARFLDDVPALCRVALRDEW